MGTVGPDTLSDGTNAPGGFRQGKSAEIIVQELHGRFFEQVYRGNVYSVGATLTALAGTTITLTASCTPILGIWNPATSTANAVLLQAVLVDQINNITSVGCGAFVWASSTGNSVISTGQAPFNRRTLASTGSAVKGFSAAATPLTGITNSLVVVEGAAFPLSSAVTTTAFPVTAVAQGVVGIQNFDGGVIVPPGAIWALLNTVSSTTHSVSGSLMWEEVPL